MFACECLVSSVLAFFLHSSLITSQRETRPRPSPQPLHLGFRKVLRLTKTSNNMIICCCYKIANFSSRLIGRRFSTHTICRVFFVLLLLLFSPRVLNCLCLNRRLYERSCCITAAAVWTTPPIYQRCLLQDVIYSHLLKWRFIVCRGWAFQIQDQGRNLHSVLLLLYSHLLLHSLSSFIRMEWNLMGIFKPDV